MKYKRLVKLLCLLGPVFVAGPSHSQDKQPEAKAAESTAELRERPESELKRHSVGLGLGQTFLMGDFNDSGNDSLSFDLLYDYSASYSFDVYADFHYSAHSLDTDKKGNLVYRKVYLPGLAAGIKAKFYQFDSFAPFGLAGFGLYAPKVKYGLFDESDSHIVFGFHFGAGVELRLNTHFKVGAVAQFHNPFDSKQDNGTEVSGSYFKLLMTTHYTF